MIKTAEKQYIFSNLPFFSWISAFIRSKWFVFCLAVFCAVSNVLGYDYYFYMAVAGIAIYISVFGKDYLPYIPLMIFSYIAPSIKNNPSKSENSIFLLDNGGKTLIIMGCAVAVFLLIRLIFDREIGFSNAVKTKYKLLGGMVFLGISYLISGLGSAMLEGFETKNLIFAGIQFLAMVIPYLVISFGVKWNKVVKDYLAFTVICFSLVVSVQIIFAYLTNGVIVDGKPENAFIISGWGVNTNMGAMVTLAIPFAFYYLAKDKNVFLSNIIILLLFFANVLSLSRNSILVGGLLYVICQIVVFSKSKKISTKIITALFIILLLTGVYLFNHYVFNMFGFSFANGLNSNGRDEIYKHAVETFYSYPLLGGGFYGINSTLHPSEVGWNAFFPRMWHNNILQVLATGGLVCFIAYLVHRIQTIKLCKKKPTIENVFIALSLLALLIMSLLDCYFFQLGPMLFYSSALAFIEHRKPHVKEEPFERFIFKRRREKLKIKNNKD
ncbi:MAG: O-antigen ligase family protein [Clostridia bacterium]|nr:O-antigen ligase family protein [Clostridia bacterium]